MLNDTPTVQCGEIAVNISWTLSLSVTESEELRVILNRVNLMDAHEITNETSGGAIMDNRIVCNVAMVYICSEVINICFTSFTSVWNMLSPCHLDVECRTSL